MADRLEADDQDVRAAFPATRHSAFVRLRSPSVSDRRDALDKLVRAYWRPVYAHVRLKWRRSLDEGRDLTQDFFASALEKGLFDGYDAARGRFRTFLRTCLDHFLANDHKAKRRQKRGGGEATVSLDFDAVEPDIAQAMAEPRADPDEAFDREWTRAMLMQSVDELRVEWERTGRTKQFGVFERYVLVTDDAARPTYAELARDAGLSPSDVSNALNRAKRDLKRIVLDRLRDITTSPEELEGEARIVLGG